MYHKVRETTEQTGYVTDEIAEGTTRQEKPQSKLVMNKVSQCTGKKIY